MKRATPEASVRIATANGSRYVVSHIDTSGPVNRVVCYAGVVGYRGTAFTRTCKTVALMGAPTVTVRVTSQLLNELVEQYKRDLRAAGHLVTESRNGRHYTDHGTKAIQELNQAFAIANAAIFSS